jgi:hypothetical protein
MIAPVGKDHLASVLAQPIADASPQESVSTEHRHHVAAKR